MAECRFPDTTTELDFTHEDEAHRRRTGDR